MTTLQRIAPVTEVERVSDGDSYWLRVDLGLDEKPLKEFRLLGWDTPETQSRNGVTVTPLERQKAQEALQLAYLWLTSRVHSAGQWTVYVRTLRDPEKWGRWLAQVWAETDAGTTDYLGETLHREGLAAPNPMKWRDIYDPSVTGR